MNYIHVVPILLGVVTLLFLVRLFLWAKSYPSRTKQEALKRLRLDVTVYVFLASLLMGLAFVLDTGPGVTQIAALLLGCPSVNAVASFILFTLRFSQRM